MKNARKGSENQAYGFSVEENSELASVRNRVVPKNKAAKRRLYLC